MCKLCYITKSENIEDYNKILMESENFYVIPSLGSIVPNWFLICSKDHFISSSKLSSKLLDELFQLVNDLRSKVKFVNNNISIFEHGPHKPKIATGCSVDHLHIHVVDFDPSELIQLSFDYSRDFVWNKYSKPKYAIQSVNSDESFLFFQKSPNENFICQKPVFESQYFRKLIAKSKGVEEKFNWRCDYFLENIDNTIINFKSSEFNKCQMMEV